MSLPWVLWIFPLPVLSSAPFLGHLFICDHRDFPSVHVEPSHCLQLVFSLHSIKPTKIFRQFHPRQHQCKVSISTQPLQPSLSPALHLHHFIPHVLISISVKVSPDFSFKLHSLFILFLLKTLPYRH
ncbi:Putative protein of unknown function [Podospora comata]|uniref:Secreted protein n=1 Tax=Podospora comata TaxID=48703 RepID=A0ABY6S184_PODCO|nr:Putative protein of unknown function [Podospora comata]